MMDNIVKLTLDTAMERNYQCLLIMVAGMPAGAFSTPHAW